MNILCSSLIDLLSSIQNQQPRFAFEGIVDFSSNGCRNACSGSCEGDCSGSCDSSCFGGCAHSFGYE